MALAITLSATLVEEELFSMRKPRVQMITKPFMIPPNGCQEPRENLSQGIKQRLPCFSGCDNIIMRQEP
ncbi:hypothetical protein M0R45_012853 [Rubus argutus]|uniref:Uncharacterized protein n=1 Tax=Rubus argutus TaxID=59490 RepID=A0AAW1XGG4_RUBAR